MNLELSLLLLTIYTLISLTILLIFIHKIPNTIKEFSLSELCIFTLLLPTFMCIMTFLYHFTNVEEINYERVSLKIKSILFKKIF